MASSICGERKDERVAANPVCLCKEAAYNASPCSQRGQITRVAHIRDIFRMEMLIKFHNSSCVTYPTRPSLSTHFTLFSLIHIPYVFIHDFDALSDNPPCKFFKKMTQEYVSKDLTGREGELMGLIRCTGQELNGHQCFEEDKELHFGHHADSPW